MGQITRCPSCGTMFKVVSDQLKISDGWVRCGHCAEVFDAQLNMQQAAMVAAAMLPLAPIAADASGEPAEAPSEGRDELAQPIQSAAAAPEEWAVEPDPVPEAAAVPVRLEPQLEVDTVAPSEPWPATEVMVAQAAPATLAEPAIDLSFMRDARRRAFWQRPAMRLSLASLALALLLVLLLQVVVDRRDRLAAAQPGLRPALEALCRLAACSIQPWRQIEALVIDGSSFNRLAPDVYRLSLSIKNVAALEVAKPAIELTLTDLREHALLRRVLTPGELGSTEASIRAAGEWAGTATVQLLPSTTGIAGYRVLAFYP